MLIMVGIIELIAAGLMFWDNFKHSMMTKIFAQMAPPPAAVTTVVTKAQSWQPLLSSVGSLRAIHGVQVSTDLAGIVAEIAFESGKPVKKGELLVKLDTKQETAQLRSAEARRDLAKISPPANRIFWRRRRHPRRNSTRRQPKPAKGTPLSRKPGH